MSRLAELLDEAAVTREVFLTRAVVFALALRLVVVACVFRGVAAPTMNHEQFGWEMGWTARSIVLGRGFSSPFLPFTGPTALVPPLYPYLIASVERLLGLYTAKSALAILSLNSVFSAFTAIPIYFGARTVLRERGARVAALVWTVYPYAIYFSADRVWDYALTGLLLSLAFWVSLEVHRYGLFAWAGFGLLCGAATLANPSVLLVLAPAGVIALNRTRGPMGDRRWFLEGLCAALVALAICLPWAIRNQRTFHQPTFIRDGFWLEFWAGNNGDTFNSNPAWAHPASNPAEMQVYESLSEPEYIAQKRELGLAFVRQHPAFFAAVSVRRVLCFWTGLWSLEPRYLKQEPTEIPDFFYCTATTLLAAWGAHRWWRIDREAALPFIAAIVFFPLTYYVTHTSPDYREPLEPIIVVLAVAGLLGPQSSDAYGRYSTESIASETDDECATAVP